MPAFSSAISLRFRPVIALQVLAGACLVLSGCRNAASEQLATEALKSDGEREASTVTQVKNVVIDDWELAGKDAKRRPLWRLKAKESRIGKGDAISPARATLKGARAELFREGRLETWFEAATMEFISTPQGIRLQMSGGVRAQTSGARVAQNVGEKARKSAVQVLAGNNVTLNAPQLDVNVAKRSVFAPRGAQLSQGIGAQRVQIAAKKLSADSGLGVASLSGGVRASTPRAQLEAKSATYNWNTNRVLAAGDIRATSGPTVLRGERLEADTRASSGVLSGNVRAQSGQSRAGAGTVNFNWDARTLSARGEVRLEKGGGSVRAARIDSDSDLNRVVASGGVQMQNAGAKVQAGQIAAFDNLTRAVASGGVRLEKDGAVLRANRVQTFDRFARAIASGSVRLEKDGATVLASGVQAFDLGGSPRVIANGQVNVSRGDVNVSAGAVQVEGLNNRNWRVRASRGVRARNNAGRVSANRVEWRGNQNGNGTVSASGGVRLEKDGYSLSGTNLNADARFQNATLRGNVSGILRDGGRISGGELVKSGNRISARGGVVARRDGVTLRAGRLDSTLDVNDARLSGGVVLTTKDGAVLSAPNLRYDRRADKVFGSGGVSFRDAKRGLNARGQSIVIHRVSDNARREAVLTGVSGSGNQRSLEGLKLF